MTVLANKEQPIVWAIGRTRKTASGTHLARVCRVHLHGHTSRERRLVGNHVLQFSKSPLGGSSIGTALLLGSAFALAPFRPFVDICQIFQPDDTVWMCVNNTPGDGMICLQLQPSLSSADDYQPTGSRTSAFLLQSFSQARIVIGFSAYRLARIEGCLVLGGGCDGKVSLSYVHTYNHLVTLGSWVCFLNLKTDQQVELLVRFVIPELGRANRRSLVDKSDVLIVSRVVDDHPPLQGQDTHQLPWLETVVPMIVVGKGRRNVLGCGVQSLVMLPCFTRFAQSSVLSDLRPQGFIGRSDLTRYVAGHLRGQLVGSADIDVGLFLQALLVTHLAVRISIARCEIQRISIGQLGDAQRVVLLRICLQFELSSEHLFHLSSLAHSQKIVKRWMCEHNGPTQTPTWNAQESPWLKARRFLGD